MDLSACLLDLTRLTLIAPVVSSVSSEFFLNALANPLTESTDDCSSCLCSLSIRPFYLLIFNSASSYLLPRLPSDAVSTFVYRSHAQMA